MKNILAENMLRFGVKNLSEKSKEKLTKKSKLDEAVLNGVKSMLEITGPLGKTAVVLNDKDPNVKYITIGTEATTPIPKVISLYAVANGSGAAACAFGGYTLVIGNIGQLNTKTNIITITDASDSACLFSNTNLVGKIKVGPASISSPENLAQLLSIICKTAAKNNVLAAQKIYADNNAQLMSIIKTAALTNTAPLPTDAAALAEFNKKVNAFTVA